MAHGSPRAGASGLMTWWYGGGAEATWLLFALISERRLSTPAATTEFWRGAHAFTEYIYDVG